MTAVRRDIVVIGGSAGAIEVLRCVVAGLPADLPATVFATVHIPATAPSHLAEILSRAGPLPATTARQSEPVHPGRILVAPPDHHLLVGSREVTLSSGPRQNGNRPSIDAMFRSAARHHDSRVTAVIVSGMLDDGSLGMLAVRRAGGLTVVQDPETATFDAMPRHAIAIARPFRVVPAEAIAELIVAAAVEGLDATGPGDVAAEPGADEGAVTGAGDRSGRPSGFSCPTCGGVLWETTEGGRLDFACRVGHELSPESLLEEQSAALDGALWAALRALEEQASLGEQLAVRTLRQGDSRTAGRFSDRAEAARRQAQVLRRALVGD
jgi:two-component system, chemotaxis family, protein-glutamate methylesterase/glutaminase